MADNFDLFIDHAGKLSKVKLLLLRTLWDNGTSFPRDWVKSSFLLDLTKQKYFDRRIRELRDQGGFDIQSNIVDGEHCWRLNSPNISELLNRTYLTNSQKDALFSKANHSCAICGKLTGAGIRGLQADHKVPLSRGGSEELENWQPICNQCNVAKRRACQGCSLDCSKCSWAYPEMFGRRIIVSIPPKLSANIQSMSDQEIEKLLLSHLNKRLAKVE
jgi:hypothetical protein